jgi:phospholipase A1/A2
VEIALTDGSQLQAIVLVLVAFPVTMLLPSSIRYAGPETPFYMLREPLMPGICKNVVCPLFLLFFSISVGLSGVSAADEQADSCGSIIDDAKRLRCYDEANGAAAAAAPMGIWRKRIAQDADRDTFTLTALKPNYFAYSYLAEPNQEPYEFLGEGDRLDTSELKFQLSFQSKLADDLFDRQADLWFGYTQVSYWQAFNTDISSPFRETNYEPEIFVSFLSDYELLGFNGGVIKLGGVHQSNGRGETLSRSWNRIFAEFVLEQGDVALSFRPWVRVDSDDDDNNPDIVDYLGNYEVRAYYNWDGQLFSAMLRNVFDSDNRYNAELQWSFPIKHRLRGLVQIYSGYGENLIDHDHNNNRISIGVLLTDWL